MEHLTFVIAMTAKPMGIDINQSQREEKRVHSPVPIRAKCGKSNVIRILPLISK